MTNFLGFIGWFLLLSGVVWFIYLGLKFGKSPTGKFVWLFTLIFLQPFSGAIFYLVKKSSVVPLLLIVTGIILRAINFAITVGTIYG